MAGTIGKRQTPAPARFWGGRGMLLGDQTGWPDVVLCVAFMAFGLALVWLMNRD